MNQNRNISPGLFLYPAALGCFVLLMVINNSIFIPILLTAGTVLLFSGKITSI